MKIPEKVIKPGRLTRGWLLPWEAKRPQRGYEARVGLPRFVFLSPCDDRDFLGPVKVLGSPRSQVSTLTFVGETLVGCGPNSGNWSMKVMPGDSQK